MLQFRGNAYISWMQYRGPWDLRLSEERKKISFLLPFLILKQLSLKNMGQAKCHTEHQLLLPYCYSPVLQHIPFHQRQNCRIGSSRPSLCKMMGTNFLKIQMKWLSSPFLKFCSDGGTKSTLQTVVQISGSYIQLQSVPII